MQLLAPHIRIVLIVTLWLITAFAVSLWWSAGRVTHVTIAGGPSGSESLLLAEAIADALNEARLG